MATRDYGQFDGVTRALELVGERWALLIVRDLLVAPRRYGELAAGLARIPTNILATRLKELQAAGVIRRAPRSRVIVYELTPFGRDFEPVVLALDRWGFRALEAPRPEQVVTTAGMTTLLRAAFRPDVAAALPATTYAASFSDVLLGVAVDGIDLTIGAQARVDERATRSDVAFATDTDVRSVLGGRGAVRAAVASGDLRVLHGDAAALDRFADTFRMAS